MNVQAYISNCQFSQITCDPISDCLSLRGVDFICMPITLNFPSIDDPADSAHGTVAECKQWLMGVGLSSVETKTYHLTLKLQNAARNDDHRHYISNAMLTSISNIPSLVVTCEDKDNNVSWLSHGPCLPSRWRYMLLQSHRWQVFDYLLHAVVLYYRKWLHTCLPKFLLTGNTNFSSRNIPIAYPTIKGKCWNGSRGQCHHDSYFQIMSANIKTC